MIIKLNELKSLNKDNFNFFLFYGPNTGLIEETIDKIFKPIFPKDVIIYDESELLNNTDSFKEVIYNKSFFNNERFIIINRATNKISNIVEEAITSQVKDIKLVIKAGILEKKSKLRSYIEKNKYAVATAFYEDNHQSLMFMIQNILKEKKIDISNEIINLIIERSKGNRINVTRELEKIKSYAKRNKKISLNDVVRLTNLAENYNTSELVDQNLLRNKKKTISILNENNINSEDNILVLRTYLNKLKRLKKLKLELKKNRNIEQVISSSRPPVFWKDKEIVKKQLNIWSLTEIKFLINKVNYIELMIKKNNQISNQILNNFILENIESSNSII